MNRIAGIALWILAPLSAQAACYVRPLTTAELSGLTDALIAGQIIQGEACRGVGINSVYTADQYSFQGKAGDDITVNVEQPNSFASRDLDGYIELLDPSGAKVAHTLHTVSSSSNPPPDTFTIKLTSTGLFKLIVTGSRAQVTDTSEVETINYFFNIKSSSPEQTPTLASCADTFSEGKLTLNSVTVPIANGGLAKYKVTLNLKPASNPAVFKIDKAELLPQ